MKEAASHFLRFGPARLALLLVLLLVPITARSDTAAKVRLNDKNLVVVDWTNADGSVTFSITIQQTEILALAAQKIHQEPINLVTPVADHGSESVTPAEPTRMPVEPATTDSEPAPKPGPDENRIWKWIACSMVGLLMIVGLIQYPKIVKRRPVTHQAHLTPATPGSSRVFFSYAAEDRDRVAPFIRAFEALNVAVLIDHQQILPGESISEGINQMINQSHGAVIFHSGAYQCKSWTSEEQNALIYRAKSFSVYRLLVVRLDHAAELPPLLEHRLWSGGSDANALAEAFVKNLRPGTSSS